MDYYVPTPAIVKSGKLAPYSDLVYLVKPSNTLSSLLEKKEALLAKFIETHKVSIVAHLHNLLTGSKEKKEVKNQKLLDKWMRFVATYR